AASGLVHEEMHGRDFTKRGGVLEMVQLWVNLPAKDKNGKPHYQSIVSGQIPEVPLPGEAGSVRVIAGEYAGRNGPASTFTPINLWDMRLKAGQRAEIRVPEGHNTLLFILSGQVEPDGGEPLGDAGLAVFDRHGDSLALTASRDSKSLLLSGVPINEPVVAHGPFVMNTE